jgi:ElaB/YqjD/DUF883 family membrane-anchored ribosome-binding protein
MPDVSTAQKDRLMNDLRVVIADAEELMRTTAGELGEGAAEARGRMQARVQQAKDHLLHVQEAALARAKAAGLAADDYVHDKPWIAIGAAAGFGLVVGLLLGRR